jgi:hypothetical protein
MFPYIGLISKQLRLCRSYDLCGNNTLVVRQYIDEWLSLCANKALLIKTDSRPKSAKLWLLAFNKLQIHLFPRLIRAIRAKLVANACNLATWEAEMRFWSAWKAARHSSDIFQVPTSMFSTFLDLGRISQDNKYLQICFLTCKMGLIAMLKYWNIYVCMYICAYTHNTYVYNIYTVGSEHMVAVIITG